MEIKAKDFKNFLSGKNNLVVETTTVGDIKQRLNELRNKTMMGDGFKNETTSALDNNEVGVQTKSKIEETEDEVFTQNSVKYKKPANPKDFGLSRKITKGGATMLGDGFKLTEAMLKKLNLTTEGLIDLVEGIVNELKGNSDYTNLRFVENIGKKYHMNESTINEMKSIIRSENSVNTGKKLFNYVTECACDQAQAKMSGHAGLNPQQNASSMISEIKSTFNENRKKMASNEAVGMTAEMVGVPTEMVQEMYEALKESKKMKSEGRMNTTGVNESLEEIYERYRGMGEGDVNGMYDEMAEMMDYPSSGEYEMAEMDSMYGGHDMDEMSIGEDDDMGSYDMGDRAEGAKEAIMKKVNNDVWANNIAPMDVLKSINFKKYGITAQDFFGDDIENYKKFMGNEEESYEDEFEFNEADDERNVTDLGQDDKDLSYSDLVNQDAGESEEDKEQRADGQLDDWMDSQHEGDVFDEIYNEMDSYMKEDGKFQQGGFSDEGNNAVEIIANNPQTGEPEEFEIFRKGRVFIVNGDSDQMQEIRVWVKNGEVVNGEYLPDDVTKAILKMNMNQQPEVVQPEMEGLQMEIDGMVSEMELDEEVVTETNIEETKSALDNLEIGVQTKSQFDESEEKEEEATIDETKSALDNLGIGQQNMSPNDEEKR